jgi:FKBP-type peptidyl-prolyl cis-trans isomerase FklB
MPSIVRHVALTLTAALALSACAKSEAPPAGGEMDKKEAAAPAGETTTASGLKYAVLTSGSGKTPGPSDTVTVHYRGTLTDGSEFDSSYKRGQPAKFPVNRVIPGWTEALQLMKEGDKWKLTIPPNLAYGAQGAGASIPPNSTLIFEVELISVN